MTRTTTRFLTTLAAGLLVALSLSACGQSKEAIANMDAAKTFMTNNAKAEGVKTLPSGVQYKIVTSGPAEGTSPKKSDEVKVHYEGKLLSGEIFDSSFQRGAPATFPLGGLIPAWVEALQQMKPGDEWLLYVPPEQGYGAQGAGPIPPNSVLIFRIQLIAFRERPMTPTGG
jgi:peptidylprolyl isomerase/FKBP-type peptidyl-prolyl cis-trans isomerase FklB